MLLFSVMKGHNNLGMQKNGKKRKKYNFNLTSLFIFSKPTKQFKQYCLSHNDLIWNARKQLNYQYVDRVDLLFRKQRKVYDNRYCKTETNNTNLQISF